MESSESGCSEQWHLCTGNEAHSVPHPAVGPGGVSEAANQLPADYLIKVRDALNAASMTFRVKPTTLVLRVAEAYLQFSGRVNEVGQPDFARGRFVVGNHSQLLSRAMMSRMQILEVVGPDGVIEFVQAQA